MTVQAPRKPASPQRSKVDTRLTCRKPLTKLTKSHIRGRPPETSGLAVHPYRIRREGDIYGRRIDLTAAGREAPVMTGIMIFNLALVAGKRPLKAVLN